VNALHRMAIVDQELPEEEGRHVGAPEQLRHAHGLVHREGPDAVEEAGGLGSAGGGTNRERRLEEAAVCTESVLVLRSTQESIGDLCHQCADYRDGRRDEWFQ
jgi:hypothetical protein